MANTVSTLSYANTFGDWLVATDALIGENNTLAAGDYTKNSGTLYLNEITQNSLQANGNIVVQKQLLVQGVGSSGTIQNTLTVGGPVYFSNTTLGLTNSGQANINGLLIAQGPGLSLSVANNAYIGGNTTIRFNTITDKLQANTSVNTTILSVTQQIFGDTVQANNKIYTPAIQANNSILTSTIVANSSISTLSLQADTIVNSAIVTAGSISTPNKIYGANYQANTSILSGTITANTTITSPTVIINSKLDGNTASAFLDSLQIQGGGLTVNGNFILTGTTVYAANTLQLSTGVSSGISSYIQVGRGSSGANAAIRWNESQKYWDMLNVTSNNYYRILTDEYFNDTLTSTSTTSVATANAVNAITTLFTTANTFLQAGVIATGSYANSAFLKANASYALANTFANTFVGTTGSVQHSSGAISFSSNNGLTIVATTANNLAISTSQDLRTTASPTFNALTLTTPLGIAQGGTGATSASSALNALLPTGTTAGYVLTTGGPGNFYWAAQTGGGGGGATPGTSINSTRLSYTANNSGQTVFATPTFTSSVQVRSYINGVRQFESEYALNQGANTITFNSAPVNGDQVLIEVDGYYVNPYYANNIAYTVNSNISPTANTIQLAIDGLTSKLTTNYANLISLSTFTADVRGITMATGTSNTSFATTSYVQNLANSSGTLTTNITGNAGTVTNGVYTSGSYSDPSWLTISKSKVGLGNVDNTADASKSVSYASTAGALTTGSNYQMNALWVGSGTPSHTSNEIKAVGNITAYVSDERLKNKLGNIENALDKVEQLSGFYYELNDVAKGLGLETSGREVGVSAQQVELVQPEAVAKAPVDDNYLTVRYERLVPLLIEAIKELRAEVNDIKGQIK